MRLQLAGEVQSPARFNWMAQLERQLALQQQEVQVVAIRANIQHAFVTQKHQGLIIPG